MLTEARDIMDRTEDRMGDAELHRLKGELMLMQVEPRLHRDKLREIPCNGGADEAEIEACYHQAIDVARRQPAKSLELRATVSLSRLWQKQGKTEEARQRKQKRYLRSYRQTK
jgi:hypothetical protein